MYGILFVTVGIVYTIVWRRQKRNIKKISIDSRPQPIDADSKPEISKDVLRNAGVEVLSHSEIIESIKNISITSRSKSRVSTSTKIAEPVRVGDTKLQIVDLRGFSVGMHIIIGTGSSIEIGIIKGLGSIILQDPVKYRHHKKTLVRGFTHEDDMNAALKLEDLGLTIQSQLELRINTYWHSLFPSIYLDDESFFKQFKREMLKHHGFISIISTTNNFQRLVYVLRFLTIMSTELLLLAIMYAIQYPAIDPNCSYMRSYADCHGITAKYDSSVHYCRWVERYMADYETKENVDMGFCTFLEPLIDLYTFVYFSLYISVVSIPVYIIIDSVFEDVLLLPLQGNIIIINYHHHYIAVLHHHYHQMKS